MKKLLHIYTDGGSRGNPGSAAIAFAIYDDKGNLISSQTRGIGITTNNVAEYTALISALETAYNYSNGEISCFSDSRLMVNQLNGKFKIKKQHLKKLHSEAKEKEKMFKLVTYVHVGRTNPRIVHVDRLLNKKLDEDESRK